MAHLAHVSGTHTQLFLIHTWCDFVHVPQNTVGDLPHLFGIVPHDLPTAAQEVWRHVQT